MLKPAISILMLLTASCSRETTAPASGLKTADLSTVEIGLERTECYGTCPSYVLTISGTGQVTYSGREFVRDFGAKQGAISEERIRELLDQFDESRFFELKDKYSFPATDLPTTFISLRAGGRSKRIEHYGEWITLDPQTGGPAEDLKDREALRALSKSIDEAVQIEHWIGTEEERRAAGRSK